MFDPMAAMAGLPKFGRGPGLDRMRRHFPDLWRDLAASGARVVHIVGSNGKGSTATFLEALLRRCGLSTGLYVSPHYFDFAERIRIDGEKADAAALEAAWRAFVDGAHDNDDFGSFEAMTAMAAHVFARAAPDVLIVEAGIGGRLDPTRLFGGTLAILTSIDLEHVEILGGSVQEIAADKMDVVGPGATIVSGWLGTPLADFCRREAEQGGKRFVDVTGPLAFDTSRFAATRRIGVGGVSYKVPAPYLVRNSLLARAAARIWVEDAAALDRAFIETCADYSAVGRFEEIWADPAVFCDLAHTPGAVREVVATCRMLFGAVKPVFVLGMSIDKHVPEMCAEVAGHGDRFLLFAARHKGQDPRILGEAIRRANPVARIEIFDDVHSLAEAVGSRPFGVGVPVVATGGLFSAIEFRTALVGGDVSALNFY